MKYIGCKLSQTEFVPNAEGCQCSENCDAVVLIFGNVLGINHKTLSAEAVLELYAQSNEAICSAITGNYTIIAFNKHSRTIHAFQNAVGSSVFLYYAQFNDCLYLNSSLFNLIGQSGIEAVLNEAVVPHFLLNGFVVGSKTLITNVQKLVPGCFLEASEKKVIQKSCVYYQNTSMADEAAETWNKVLSEVLEESYSNGTSIALSSGYDSNYILQYGLKKGAKPINAFSIGGNFEGNELPAVKKIAALYPSVNLNCATTDTNTFHNFPDIVCRLEGQVYEQGVFLQYELARLVASNGSQTLICGECANEVMSIDFRINQDSDILPQALSSYILEPYNAAAYIIIKKSGILLNSFGIDSRYPFADQCVINSAHSLRYNNCQSKSFHVENCKSLFPDEVFSLLGNRAGSTKESSFMDAANYELLDMLMSDNSFFRRYGKKLFDAKFTEPYSVQRIPNYNTHIRNPFRLIRSEISARKSDIANVQRDRSTTELKVKLICLYLDIFSNIFKQNGQGRMIEDYYNL